MKISVILTSYNHDKFLAESIDSVINQTYRDFEFIIVDDCSTDSSWQIIEEYKNAYPEIIILRHEYNWGSGNVADTVRNYASGEYIAVHHSDDVWEADKLEKQITVFKEHPDYAAVFTNAGAIDEKGNIYDDKNGFYYNLFQVQNRSRHEWLEHFFFHGNCLCHPSILVKKSVYEENDFFRKGLKQIPDFVKWIQICKKYEIYVIPEVLVKFRIHSAGQNTSGMRAETQVRSTVELFLMLQEYADIKEREEFFAIFPGSRKYCTGKNISTKYIFGRICTEEGMPPYTRLFGIQLLYKALNSDDYAEQMQIRRSFSVNDFFQMNGRYDLFGVLPKAFEQDRTIYFDCGNGYNAENTVKESYTFEQELVFQMKTCIQTPDNKGIKRLRFDPAEGVLIKARIKSITVNGEKIGFAAENALKRKDEEDIFINMDPIYELELPRHIVGADQVDIDIQGKISRLTDDEIGSIVTEFMYCSRDEHNALRGKLEEEEEKNRSGILQNERLLENEKELKRNSELISGRLDQALQDKNSLEKKYEIILDELNKAEEYKAGLEEEKKKISCELYRVSEAMRSLDENRDILLDELKKIKSTRWYKVWNKYMKMRERRQRSE